jgi:hypothetical protein
MEESDLARFPIDQAESQRPGRPVETRGLANGLGRVRVGPDFELLPSGWDRLAARRFLRF